MHPCHVYCMVDPASPNCNHMTTWIWGLDIYVRSQFVHEQKQKKLQQKAKNTAGLSVG